MDDLSSLFMWKRYGHEGGMNHVKCEVHTVIG